MTEPIYAVVEDFYNKEELKLIWRELEFLRYKMQIAETTSTAVVNGKLLKKGKIHNFYSNSIPLHILLRICDALIIPTL